MNNKFTIVIGSYNNSKWVESNIASVLTQDYTDYNVLYYDDNSSDGTFDKVKSLVGNDSRFKLHNSIERKYKTWFFSNHLNNVSDNTILVFLDGDDMFASENVLSYLNEVYNQTSCWMTYGGMRVWDGGEDVVEPYPQNSEIPDIVKKNKAYRKDTWRTSHLKTMRGFLWNKFDKKDLCPNGTYMVGPDDLAIMFSMLEICPPNKVYRVPDPLYIYNHSDANNNSRAFSDHKQTKIDYESIVRSRKPYDTISFVTPLLAGGLGNQMFEIAAAASLAKDNNAVLLVNNNEHILPNQGRNVNTYRNNIFKKIVFDKNIPSIENVYKREICTYEPIPYSPNLKTMGHFQSWKYFDHNKEYIKDLFSYGKNYSESYKGMTGIQVRRGDYAKFPDYHPLLPAEYYIRAVKEAKADNIVIFSDDIEWCKKNLEFNVPVMYYKDEDYLELATMCDFEKLIISNSSFGWWAAYLNSVPNKEIYVPSIWFGKAMLDQGFNIDDLLLPDWKRIQI